MTTATIDAECAPISVSEAVQSAAGRWWVIKCNGRWEARMVRDVQERGGLPIIIHRRRQVIYKDENLHLHRDVTTSRAFPYTTFINIDPGENTDPHDYFSSATHNLAPLSVHRIRNQKRFSSELTSIAIASEYCDLGEAQRIQDGTRVRITAGVLIGSEGIVLQNKPGIVCLMLTMMGAMHEVPVDDIEPI